MKKEGVNFKILNLVIILSAALLIYLMRGLWMGIVDKSISIVFPFIIAFAIAYALYPFVKKLENKGLPKWLSVGITTVLSIGLFITVAILIVPIIYKQSLLFLSNISTFITDISIKYEINLGSMQSTLSSISSDIVKTVGTYISDGAINFVNQSFSLIAAVVIILFVAVYFLVDMEKIRNYIKVTLKKRKNRSYAYIKKIDTEITNYFTGMGRNMLIQFFEYTLAFLIIGHPNFLILGILAAITNIIPYIGGFIVNVFALIIASVISTKLTILTLIVCLICPQIDSYIIGPRIYGKTNNLHPLVSIFAVFAGGILLGFWGILISLPVAIIIIATYNFFKKDISSKIGEIKEKN